MLGYNINNKTKTVQFSEIFSLIAHSRTLRSQFQGFQCNKKHCWRGMMQSCLSHTQGRTGNATYFSALLALQETGRSSSILPQIYWMSCCEALRWLSVASLQAQPGHPNPTSCVTRGSFGQVTTSPLASRKCMKHWYAPNEPPFWGYIPKKPTDIQHGIVSYTFLILYLLPCSIFCNCEAHQSTLHWCPGILQSNLNDAKQSMTRSGSCAKLLDLPPQKKKKHTKKKTRSDVKRNIGSTAISLPF